METPIVDVSKGVLSDDFSDDNISVCSEDYHNIESAASATDLSSCEGPNSKSPSRNSSSSNGPILFSVDANSDMGMRDYMEDALTALPQFNEQLGLEDAVEDSAFFGIYDGHGGQGAARFAQSNLHFHLASQPNLHDNPAAALKEAIAATDRSFLEKAPRNKNRVGSTACCTLVRESQLHCAWVGDSEAYLYRTGAKKPLQLVNPHSPLRPDELRRIEKTGGVVTFDSAPVTRPHGKKRKIGRVNGVLAVSRALGDAALKEWVIGEPESATVDLNGSEEFLLMASDGLFDVMTAEDAGKIVRNYVRRQLRRRKADATHGAARHLIQVALDRKSMDNISVVLVFFKNSPAALSSADSDSDFLPSLRRKLIPSFLRR